MICRNCGTEVPDSARLCWVCGNELHETSIKPKTQTNISKKAFMIHIIAGVIAVLCLFTPLLPFNEDHGELLSIFSNLFSEEYSSEGMGFTIYYLFLMMTPASILAVWAVFSFMRKRAAGIIGIVASGTYIIYTSLWTWDRFVASVLCELRFIIPSPVIMFTLGIAGVVTAIIQVSRGFK